VGSDRETSRVLASGSRLGCLHPAFYALATTDAHEADFNDDDDFEDDDNFDDDVEDDFEGEDEDDDEDEDAFDFGDEPDSLNLPAERG